VPKTVNGTGNQGCISDMAQKQKLTDDERRVLQFLADEAGGDYGFFGFNPLMRETGFDRKRVRRACRSLRRKGLTEFGRGLWSDDGEPAGSGYGATRAGVELICGPQ
jgi:hypothetical protein